MEIQFCFFSSEKLKCVNHVAKRMGTNLRGLIWERRVKGMLNKYFIGFTKHIVNYLLIVFTITTFGWECQSI